MTTQTIGRKSKELLAITILLNIAAFGWYGFLLADVKAKNEHIFALTNQIDVEAAKENTLNSQKTFAAETALLREKLTSHLIKNDEAVSFLEFLEMMGNEMEVHVTVKSVGVNDLPQFQKGEALQLKLYITGTWPALVRYLGLLEFLPYEASIGELTVSNADSLTEEPWEANLSLTVLKEK